VLVRFGRMAEFETISQGGAEPKFAAAEKFSAGDGRLGILFWVLESLAVHISRL